MKPTKEHNEKIAKMKFASVYPNYVNKIEKKGRTKKELFQVIEWLTGYDESKFFADNLNTPFFYFDI